MTRRSNSFGSFSRSMVSIGGYFDSQATKIAGEDEKMTYGSCDTRKFTYTIIRDLGTIYIFLDF